MGNVTKGLGAVQDWSGSTAAEASGNSVRNISSLNRVRKLDSSSRASSCLKLIGLDLNKIKEAFAAFGTPSVNEVIERYHFWQVLMPGSNETIDAFVSTLRAKAKIYNSGDQLEMMIRDRIVFTCPDKWTKEALIRDDKLDLESAVRICRAAESSRKSMHEPRVPVVIHLLHRCRLSYTVQQQPAPRVGMITMTTHAPASRRLAHASAAVQNTNRVSSAYGKEVWQVSPQGPLPQVVPRRSSSQSKSSVGRSLQGCCHAADAGNSIDNDVYHIDELVMSTLFRRSAPLTEH
jgi:hypothetical protein